jgi:hypothetical protein
MSFGKFQKVIEAIETGAMTVAEIETQGVVSDLLPAGDCNAWKVLGAIAAVLVAEDVALANILCAGRGGSQRLHRIIRLRLVGPKNGDFVTDELDVGGSLHGANG